MVPVYNEGFRAVKVLNNILRYFKGAVVVVDDGSIDDTAVELRKLCDMNGRIVLLTHIVNMGKGASVKTGVEKAWSMGAEAVIVIDSDGQHDPKYIPRFEKELERSSIVFGYRELDSKVPYVRRIGNKIASKLVDVLFNVRKKDLLSGYMAFKIDVYPLIYWYSSRYGLETEMAIKIGRHNLKFREIKIDTIYIDKYKGVSILDAIKILIQIPVWMIEK